MSEVDDRACEGASDAGDHLHAADHELAEIVHRLGLSPNDHVVGPGDDVGMNDTVQCSDRYGNFCGLVHVRLHEDVRRRLGHGLTVTSAQTFHSDDTKRALPLPQYRCPMTVEVQSNSDTVGDETADVDVPARKWLRRFGVGAFALVALGALSTVAEARVRADLRPTGNVAISASIVEVAAGFEVENHGMLAVEIDRVAPIDGLLPISFQLVDGSYIVGGVGPSDDQVLKSLGAGKKATLVVRWTILNCADLPIAFSTPGGISSWSSAFASIKITTQDRFGPATTSIDSGPLLSQLATVCDPAADF